MPLLFRPTEVSGLRLPSFLPQVASKSSPVSHRPAAARLRSSTLLASSSWYESHQRLCTAGVFDLTLLQGWFIFTFVLLLCTLRSTVAFFFLFFTLDMTFLMLGIGYLENSTGAPNTACIKAGGAFGILAAFAAWSVALSAWPRVNASANKE